MNILKGTISTVHTNGELSVVRLQAGSVLLTAIVIDTPESASYLHEGNEVKVIFKETEVIIGQGTGLAVSLRNQLAGHIEKIERGELLSKVTVKTAAGKITSIITTNAVQQLGLQVGSEATAMIKTNEMMLSEK